MSLLVEPPDGRPFLLSTSSPEKLAANLRQLAVVGLGLMVASGVLLLFAAWYYSPR